MQIIITLKIKDTEITLSEEEAKELHDKLHTIFGRCGNWYPVFPTPLYPQSPYITYTADNATGNLTKAILASWKQDA